MRRSKLLLSIIAIVVMSVSLSACEPLRKKFTRQKKKDRMENKDFVPVLEPLEYPAPADNPKENYKGHYSLIKAWYKDLWTAIEENGSDKKIQYTIKQIYFHIDEMQKLVVPQKQAELTKLKGLLAYYEESLNSPSSMRNISRIQSDLRAFDRQLRGQLSANKIEGDLVAASHP